MLIALFRLQVANVYRWTTSHYLFKWHIPKSYVLSVLYPDPNIYRRYMCHLYMEFGGAVFNLRNETFQLRILWILIGNYSDLCNWITTKFCTCLDRTVVVACSKCRCDLIFGVLSTKSFFVNFQIRTLWFSVKLCSCDWCRWLSNARGIK